MSRLLPILLLACASPAEVTDTASPPKVVVDCVPDCARATCPSVEICVESRDGAATATWYAAGNDEYPCNGSDCASAAEAVLAACGACL